MSEKRWPIGEAAAFQQQQEAVEAALAADREAALRDVFAASALGALIAHEGGRRARMTVSEDAYAYADAMLKARKK